jgi:hypothetical protein
MKIQLKEKHLCFIASQLKNYALSDFFRLVMQIREKLVGNNLAPDDLVEISTTPQELTSIYTMMGQKAEGLVVGINAAMKADLLPQLVSMIIQGVLAVDATAEVMVNGQPNLPLLLSFNLPEGDGKEAQTTLTIVSQREEINSNWAASEIEKGRALILS